MSTLCDSCRTYPCPYPYLLQGKVNTCNKFESRIKKGCGGVQMNGLRLNVIITKTSKGDQDYIQIISQDMFSVNSVFVADKIVIEDKRK